MKIVAIQDSDGKCELCGAVGEVRPYGPGGKLVCFDCGMKDEAEAERQFFKLIGAADVVVLNAPPDLK